MRLTFHPHSATPTDANDNVRPAPDVWVQGWVIQVEAIMGEEFAPLIYAAVHKNHREAMRAVQHAVEVAQAYQLHGKDACVLRCELLGTLQAETVRRLGLETGGVYRI